MINMSSGVLFRSELLFYIQNNVASVPRDVLMTTLCGFFTESEVLEAKNALFGVAATVAAANDGSSYDLPRIRVRRGDGKQRADAGDILDLWEVIDTSKIELPLFVAANQKRIPPVAVADSDLCVMSVYMIELKEQMKVMASEQKRLVDAVAAVHTKVSQPQVQLASSAASDRRALEAPVLSPVDTVSQAPRASWASVVQDAVASNVVMQLPRRPPVIMRPPVLHGKKELSSTGSGLKSAPRRIAAFVGRLHKDTSETELQTYMKDAGLINPWCKKLSAKDGRVFNTAAFMVTCDYGCHDTFYNEATWPEGCELRDWVFYGKNKE